MIPPHLARLTLATGVLLLAAHPAWAAEGGEKPKPTPWLKSLVDKAKTLAERKVKADSDEEKKWKAEIKATVDDILDWEELTERSLGRHWKKRSEAEQKEFASLLREMIEASYQSKLRLAARNKVKKPKDVTLKWMNEEIKGDKAEATCEVKADKTTAVLEFQMIWKDKGWRVYDVSIDDVSTVRTYRSQFGKIVAKDGFPALIERMKSKTKEIREGKSDLLPEEVAKTEGKQEEG